MAHVSNENDALAVAKPKELLAKWCSEKNLDPQFKFSVNKKNQKYRCELEIPGYNYVGIGNSKLKKSAQKKATKDFLLFLVSKNAIPTIPKKIKNTETSEIDPLTKELKSLSIKPVVYGNWTEESALKRLKQFIKSNKKNIFAKTCELTEKSYRIEMSIFIEKLNKTFVSCEKEKSKILATQKCALSLVSQLCRCGQIERNLSAQKKKDKVKFAHEVFEVVDVNENLVNDVYSLLDELDIVPMIDKNSSIVKESKSLILQVSPEPFSQSNQFSSARVISWCPPMSNWNPWLSIKILNPKSLMDISCNMERKVSIKTKQSFAFQKRMKDRSNLPIFDKKNAILDIINYNSVVIVQGGTGCGKTTQVCQFILDEHINIKKGAQCNIICTQPRKVSAISIANRVAFERAENLGESIGYTVRFDSVIPKPFGAILFCTVEILIRKLRKGLIGISHVIVDEIHERHADSEFLLIILKEMVQKYPDLRVILMSANANLKTFSEYFNNCPIINVQGRCYPVKEHFLEDIVQILDYKPVQEKNNKKKIDDGQVNCNLLVSKDYPGHIRNKVAIIDEDSHHLKIVESLLIFIENSLKIDGAVLIFLPGWAWIIELNDHLLQKDVGNKWSILLLHSTLSHAEQHKVFRPPPKGKRKVILSTNIAETSITIDDVVFVIDYGKVKQVEFCNNITKFNTVWASKVNVEQRKGRAGRVQQGICFNLYTKARFNLLNDNITPELIRCPLSKIGLSIKLLHLGDIHTFLKKAIDPPPFEAVNSVIIMLKEMKCFEANGDLTALGNILAQLPVEPKYGRMMILGNILMLGEFLSIIAAGSSTNYDLFLGSYDENSNKDNYLSHHCSDQIHFLNAFLNEDSEEYDLSTSALITTHNIKNQIIKMFIQLGFPECCFERQSSDDQITTADETPLDLIPALLTMAFYPNIYHYKGKRKVNLKTKEFALVSRFSVNSHKMDLADQFYSPFFVFEEQVNVMCVHSTMVSPIHLLLFGATKVEYIDNMVVIDDWIFLKMNVRIAAAIVALRPAIEDLIIRTTKNPKLLLKPNKVDTKLIRVLRNLCNFNAGRNHLSPITFNEQ